MVLWFDSIAELAVNDLEDTLTEGEKESWKQQAKENTEEKERKEREERRERTKYGGMIEGDVNE